MAYYMPKYAGCFGSGCADIFPGDAPAAAPGLSPYPMTPGDVSVDVSVEGGGYGPRGETGPGGMVVYGPGAPERGLPWWLWLVIGYLVAKAVKEG